ncbi:MAG: FAD-dependent oxidoreductase [Cyanobacteria bacterium J06631_12]
MPADYDLVILGGTLEGRTAAAAAAGYGARVALVEPPGLFLQRQKVRYLLRGLQQLAEGCYRQSVSSWFQHPDSSTGLPTEAFSDRTNTLSQMNWAALVKWSALAATSQCPELSVAALSRRGVDVVLAMPERLSRRQVVTVANRQLKARAVLAAFGTVPHAAGVSGPGHLSRPVPTGLEQLLPLARLPQQIAIWGESFEAVLWAEALGSLGVTVTLISDGFLAREDSDAREWIRTSLSAAGIKLVAVENFSEADFHALADTITLFLGRQQPALSLPDFIRRAPHPGSSPPFHHSPETHSPETHSPETHSPETERGCLLANARLQTSQARVFACGSLLHGECVHESVARAEAQVAVWNALFIPRRRVDYGAIAQGYDRFVRVGLPPEFAIAGRTPDLSQGYSVWTASCANGADLSRVSPQPSHCKLICQRKHIQSIHLLGDGAEHLVPRLESVIGNPVRTLTMGTRRSPIHPLSEHLDNLITIAARKAQPAEWQPGHWRRDWAENWFNWRRSR